MKQVFGKKEENIMNLETRGEKIFKVLAVCRGQTSDGNNERSNKGILSHAFCEKTV